MRSLDAVGSGSAVAEGRSEGQELEHLGSRGEASFQPESSSPFSAARTVPISPSTLARSQSLRLGLVLEIATVLSEAFAGEDVEELLKHHTSEYICQVLLTVGHSTGTT